ncbi:Armadillo [Corchorus capsularis]|uniref:Armadillo n=1 Tax=Corchorus capsularis TaxID=210143 RepID=A0A1R3FWD8_COCAP|nr:Armadillo [Corchorus capsularis]
MESALPTLMASSSAFFQSGSLLKSLIHVSNEVTSMEKLPFIQVRNISTMIRRIKLLSSLFEEIEDMNTPLPPSSVLCLTELFSVIRRVKVLIESCKDGSTLWGLIQTQVISNQFYVLVKEMGRAMDILPLSLLNITTDIKEQVELLHKQAKRVELFVDPKEIQTREKLLQVMASNNEKNRKNYHHHQSFIDIETVKEVLSSIGMRSPLDYEEEISKLEAESQKQAERCSSSSNASELEASNSKKKASEKAVDHISATKAAMDAVKMTAEFLVGKLAMGSPDIQRQAAYELRLLAKTGMDNRRIIAEAGAIPFLVTLLSSNDARIQENAVTALLNLSIFDNNKVLIMAAGAIDNIVEVLESGKTMEARENAAAAIFSLSMIDDFKISIGAGPRAILALVGLLREGTTAGKRDAATALFNLALYSANKARIVVSGAIPLLIELLMDDKAGITDDALGVLALLLSCSQGLEAVKKSRVLVPLLIDLLRFGSAKGKENSITLLLGLCKDGGEEVARRLLINPRSIPSLQSLSADGSLKARRKADALLRLLNRCCSQTHNPVG